MPLTMRPGSPARPCRSTVVSWPVAVHRRPLSRRMRPLDKATLLQSDHRRLWIGGNTVRTVSTTKSWPYSGGDGSHVVGHRRQRRARRTGSCLVIGRPDHEPAPEGALEHVALLLGRPSRHTHVFLGFEVQLDVAVADLDARRADVLVTGPLKLLSQPQHRGAPVEQRLVASFGERLE